MGIIQLSKYGIERELDHVGERYRNFPHAFFASRVDYTYWRETILFWCEERFGLSGGDIWRTSDNMVWFRYENHAMEFKLRWL
jgi:hypothetical protein